jgi:N-acetylmuramoyl-L-alanine amidase CwlA
MNNLFSKKITISEDLFFVHSIKDEESVVILNYDDDIQQYYKLTHLAADVTKLVIKTPGITLAEISEELLPHYDSQKKEFENELSKIVDKLTENKII